MNDQEKKQQIDSFEKKYKGRRGFRNIFNKAQRNIYAKDILQPHQEEFGSVYKTAKKNIKLIHDAVDRQVVKKEKELEEAYRLSNKNVLTLEQVTLKELKSEHPTMVDEEDVIKWQTKT